MDTLKILVVDDESRMRKAGQRTFCQRRISRCWKPVMVKRPVDIFYEE